MIIQVIMFTVKCDNCGVDVNKDAEYSAWNDKQYSEYVAMEAGWLKEVDKHYCNNCYEYDDNDKLIIKEIK